MADLSAACPEPKFHFVNSFIRKETVWCSEIMCSSFMCSPCSHTLSCPAVRSTRITPTFCLCSKLASTSSDIMSYTWCLTVLTKIQLIWAKVINLLLGYIMRAASIQEILTAPQQRYGLVALGLGLGYF